MRRLVRIFVYGIYGISQAFPDAVYVGIVFFTQLDLEYAFTHCRYEQMKYTSKKYYLLNTKVYVIESQSRLKF